LNRLPPDITSGQGLNGFQTNYFLFTILFTILEIGWNDIFNKNDSTWGDYEYPKYIGDTYEERTNRIAVQND
jgi:hypothetical protein